MHKELAVNAAGPEKVNQGKEVLGTYKEAVLGPHDSLNLGSFACCLVACVCTHVFISMWRSEDNV